MGVTLSHIVCNGNTGFNVNSRMSFRVHASYALCTLIYLSISRCVPLICLSRAMLSSFRVFVLYPCTVGFKKRASVTPVPPFQAHRHQRALSSFEEMKAAGVTPDRETFSAAAEACACISSTDASGGGMGARAMEIMRMARDQGLRRPAAKAVAATLAACVGGGLWRRAIPAMEAMLVASGRHAWDDVMDFLAEAQLGRRSGERQVLDAELETGDGGGAVVAADVEEPHVDSSGGSGACVTGNALHTTQAEPSPAAVPLQAAKYPGRSEAQDVGGGNVSQEKREASACGSVRLQTRPISEVVQGPSSEEEADGERGRKGAESRRSRQPRPRPSKTARAAAATASLKLGGVSALAAAAEAP